MAFAGSEKETRVQIEILQVERVYKIGKRGITCEKVLVFNIAA